MVNYFREDIEVAELCFNGKYLHYAYIRRRSTSLV